MNLRPYQQQAADAIFRAWEDAPSTLVVLPTGTGKTLLFAEVIRRNLPGRALVLAHRGELVYQAKDKIERFAGIESQIEMADLRADEHGLLSRAPAVVGSIQTQTSGGDGGGRMSKFDPMNFNLLVIDECHHAISPIFRRCMDYYRRNPALRILGVTATPDRADEEALGQVFGSVAFDYEILDAINDGWLVPVEQQMVHVSGLDFSGCRTTAGDLNGADLSAVMEAEESLHGIADPAFRIAEGKRAILFAASVEQAERLAEILNRHRQDCAAWVCGKTDKDTRRKILSDFASGRVQFVCNCGVLTEGFDDAGVELIFMARPTKSRALYAQMAGRAIRPADSIAHALNDAQDATVRRRMIEQSAKPRCLIVDFVGNSGRHKLMTTADILGGNVSDEAAEEAVRKARETGKPVDMAEALKKAQAEIEARKRAEEAKRLALKAKAQFTTSKVNPFDVLDISPAIERGWHKGKTLSEKQAALLMKNGINPEGLPYVQAKQVLDEMFRRWGNGLATFGQAKVLKKNGIHVPLRREEASRMIDRIASQQNWKRGAA